MYVVKQTLTSGARLVFQREVAKIGARIICQHNAGFGKLACGVSDEDKIPKKIFSGIQPTGSLHLGNYLGAVRNWVELQEARLDVTYCIVDMHAITLPKMPYQLREDIFKMAATLMACGIDPNKSTLFVQSAVKEHGELCWILMCNTTMARLGHLPQYKEKMRNQNDFPLGIFVYPVLQAADILLHKATHVPVGEDQVQHIQLAQHLAKTFNTKYGNMFPICHAEVYSKLGSRIRSLREPIKKMSKSDPDPRSYISIIDEPDVIVEKIKKAVTDFKSDVSYEPEARLGVSNLIAIHSLVTGKTTKEIVEECKTLDTGKYKGLVSEAIIEHLKPIRLKINQYLINRHELIFVLENGAMKARQVAAETLSEVKNKLGLGADCILPPMIAPREEEKIEKDPEKLKEDVVFDQGKLEKPIVPIQPLRVEKKRKTNVSFQMNIKTDPNSFDYSMDVNAINKDDLKPILDATKSDAIALPSKLPKDFKM